jgi:hypothetical protein
MSKQPTILQMPDAEYFSLEEFNNSFFKTVRQKSLGHAMYEKEHPKSPTASMEFGTLAHWALMQPDEFKRNAFVMPEGNKNSKDFKQRVQRLLNMNLPPSNVAEIDVVLQQRGMVKIEADMKLQILELSAKISQSKTWKTIADGATYESTILFECPDTALPLKAKLDVLNTRLKVIMDVKTTKDASHNKFAKDAWNYGYLYQASHYRQAVEELTGEEFEYWICAIENTAPYAFTFYKVPSYNIDVAHDGLLEIKKQVKEAVKTNHFPFYPEIQTLEVA